MYVSGGCVMIDALMKAYLMSIECFQVGPPLSELFSVTINWVAGPRLVDQDWQSDRPYTQLNLLGLQ